jgi:hypothetical protein
MVNDEFPGLAPINFFKTSASLHHATSKKELDIKKHQLPNASLLCGEEGSFADVSLGWSKEGLYATVATYQPYHRSFYPDITKGDSVEFFIDTRDIKTSGYNTRFCHHFYFLPEAIEGHHAGEITRFRTEETHQHCEPALLKISATLRKNNFDMEIFIPSECLYGYDPDQFDRLGFSYRINRPDGPSQHFSAVSDEYKIEEQPSLWSSLRLVT